MILRALAVALAASVLFGGWQTQVIHSMRAEAVEAALSTAEAGRIAERSASLKSHEANVAQQKVNDDKDSTLRRVRADAAADIDRVRNRPDAPALPSGVPAPTACAGATGAELYRAHAEFLVREAARAEELRVELGACQMREVMR